MYIYISNSFFICFSVLFHLVINSTVKSNPLSIPFDSKFICTTRGLFPYPQISHTILVKKVI